MNRRLVTAVALMAVAVIGALAWPVNDDLGFYCGTVVLGGEDLAAVDCGQAKAPWRLFFGAVFLAGVVVAATVRRDD